MVLPFLLKLSFLSPSLPAAFSAACVAFDRQACHPLACSAYLANSNCFLISTDFIASNRNNTSLFLTHRLKQTMQGNQTPGLYSTILWAGFHIYLNLFTLPVHISTHWKSRASFQEIHPDCSWLVTHLINTITLNSTIPKLLGFSPLQLHHKQLAVKTVHFLTLQPTTSCSTAFL